MSKSKFFSLLESLSISQCKDLPGFSQMPSNKLTSRDREILVAVVDSQRKRRSPTEDDMWANILEAGEEKDLNKIKSRLFKMVERYLGMVGVESNQPLRYVMLARHGVKHGKPKYARAIMKKGIAEFQRTPAPDNRLALFWLYEIYLDFEKEARKYEGKIDELNQTLEDFYSWHKIRLLCEKASREKILTRDTDIGKHQPEIDRLYRASQSPHVRAYYHIFGLIDGEDPAHLAHLEDYLATDGIQLSDYHYKEIYTHLFNFYVQQFNQGEFAYAKKIVQMVHTLENRKLLLENNEIGTNRLLNYIAACLALKEYQQAYDFFQKYRGFLHDTPTVNKSDFAKLFEAMLQMYMGDLERCITLINEFRMTETYKKDNYHRITCEKLLIKALYIEKEYETALHKIERIKSLIKSKEQMPKEREAKYFAFFKILKALINKKRVDIEARREQLLMADYLWLLDLK